MISLNCNVRVQPFPAAQAEAETMITSNSGYYLNPTYLEELAGRYRNAYRQAKPFPHIVIDNFLPAKVLEQVLDELSALDCDQRQRLSEIAVSKITQPGVRQAQNNLTLPPKTGGTTDWLLDQFNSVLFINFLEQLTRVEGLLPNSQVESIGLPALEQGSPFKIQVDCDRYVKSLDRKLTFLIYLNKNWKEEYGGHLELWNAEMTHCEKKILPIFNRCVIFSTTSFSYYGHPEPLNCPDHETRKLLALYYYSKEQWAEITRNALRTPALHKSPEETVKHK